MKHLLPRQAWDWIQQHASTPPEQQPLFVDVRMEIESLYVGCLLYTSDAADE